MLIELSSVDKIPSNFILCIFEPPQPIFDHFFVFWHPLFTIYIFLDFSSEYIFDFFAFSSFLCEEPKIGYNTKDQNEKSAQIEDLSLNPTRFSASFHLNETTHFEKNGVVSYILKKRSKNSAVLIGTICLLLPLDVQRIGEEEAFSPLLYPLPLSPKPPKRRRQNSLLAYHMVEEEGMHL